MDKYEKALTKTTKTERQFEFNDLLELAKIDNINCDNCKLLYKPFENTTLKFKDHIECRILQVKTPKNTDTFFCSNFNPKDK